MRRGFRLGWIAGRERRLAVGALVCLAFLPTPGGASCQTTWCYQQWRNYEEKSLAEARAEALANPRDGEKWNDAYGFLARAAERRRGIAAFKARFEWAPQPALDRWPELERQAAAEREAWLALWLEADPDGTDVLCRAAEHATDVDSALEKLAADVQRHPDDEKLVRCLVQRANGEGRFEVGLAAARDLVERRGDKAESWSVLIEAATSAHDDAARVAALEERAERFPDRPWFRHDVLQALSGMHADAELERMFARYSAEAASPAELQPLCIAFAVGSLPAKDCHLAVLAADRGGEISPDDASALQSAHYFLLMRAIHAKDLPEVERLNLGSSASKAVNDWSVALDWLKADACPAFRRDFESGRLLPVRGDLAAGWQLRDLTHGLETCGAVAAAHELLDTFGVGDRSLSLEARLETLERRVAEEHLAAAPNDAMAQYELDSVAYSLPPAERIAYLSARLQATPDFLRLRQELQKALTELAKAGSPEAALVSAAHSLALYPEDLDWSLQIAFFDLEWKDVGAARSIANDVLRTRTATPRQRDEAEFVLARLEIRAGRFAEASDRLERYFLDRLRYEGCLEDADCDVAMALDLLAGLDRERLTSYLARRAEALAYFRTVIAPATEIGDGRMMQRPWPQVQWTATLVAAPPCRQEDTLARLRAAHAWSRPMRLGAAAKLPECSPVWGDLEKALDRAAPERVWAKLTRID